jgi:small subunit ribosomal protein S20
MPPTIAVDLKSLCVRIAPAGLDYARRRYRQGWARHKSQSARCVDNPAGGLHINPLFRANRTRIRLVANSASAAKRARQAVKRRERNMSQISRVRTYIKNVVKAITKGDKAAAQASYQRAVPIIDSGVNKKLIHKNKAARHKSRLNARIKAMQ